MRSRRFVQQIASGIGLLVVLAACGGSTTASSIGVATTTGDAPGTTLGDTATTLGDTATTLGDTGTTVTAGGEGSIWVLLPDSASSARWETDDRRFFQEAFAAAGLVENDPNGFTIVNAEGDAATQQSQAEQAIASGATVILLVNLDSGSGAAIIAAAHGAGAAVVDYDRLTIEGEGADVYVSFDNVAVGQTMADVLTPVIDALAVDVPQVAMLNGGPTDNNSTLFKEGYGAIVTEKVDAGEWALAADEDTPNWDNQEALRIFEQMLTNTGGAIDAVFAANDGLAGSVIAALQAAEADPIPLSGQDATAAGIQNILAGWQTMTVYKPIKAEAAAAAAAALALYNGEDVTALSGDFAVDSINNGTSDLPFIALTPIGVTVDNIAETVIADGFRTWDEVCTGDFAEFCPADATN